MGSYTSPHWVELCFQMEECDCEECLQKFEWLKDQMLYSDFIRQASYQNA